MPSVSDIYYDGYRGYPIDNEAAQSVRWRDYEPNAYVSGHSDIVTYRTDHWHQGLPTQVVGLNSGALATVHFRDAQRSIMRVKGVALTEAERKSDSLEHWWVGIDEVLPYQLRDIERMEVVIKWKGYPEMVADLILYDYTLERHRTLREIAEQIACAWRKFYNKRKMHLAEALTYHNGDFPLRLGSDGITFDHIRLEQIYTDDGERWYLTTNFVLPAIPGSAEYEADPGAMHYDDVHCGREPWMLN